VSNCLRVCKVFDLKPRHATSWLINRDEELWAKAADDRRPEPDHCDGICGLGKSS
jgi:hypothetical protein